MSSAPGNRTRLTPSRVGRMVLLSIILLLASGCGPAFEADEDGDRAGMSAERGTDTDHPVDVRGEALPADVEEAVVADTVDGDTIEVVFLPDDRQFDVRLVGIDSPESVRPNSPVECYGPESSRRLAELLPVGTTVYLERDVSDTDRLGRLLRHVWIVDEANGDAYLISEVLAHGGYADARTYPPDDRYADRLADAERAARAEGAGLWGACAG